MSWCRCDDHLDEIVFRTRALSILADDGSGTSWDPIKVEGEVPLEDRVDEAAGEAEAPAAAEVVVAGAGTASRPTSGCGTAPCRAADVPARDAYALRLVAGRRLYDARAARQREPGAHAASRRPFRVARQSARRVAGSVSSAGAEVKVTSTRGSQVVAIAPDPGVPDGHRAARFLRRRLGCCGA